MTSELDPLYVTHSSLRFWPRHVPHVPTGTSVNTFSVVESTQFAVVYVLIISGSYKYIVSDDLKKKEKFYLCKILSGKIEKGNGPEFTNPNLEKYGKYEIVELDIDNLHKYNLLPLDIKDYISNNLK